MKESPHDMGLYNNGTRLSRRQNQIHLQKEISAKQGQAKNYYIGKYTCMVIGRVGNFSAL